MPRNGSPRPTSAPTTSPLPTPPSDRHEQESPPPLYESSTNERVGSVDNDYFMPPGGPPPSPPPGFAMYAAKYSEDENGCIISHDPHLNEDGEALYRFVLAQSLKPPQLLLHVKGEHQEHQTRPVANSSDGHKTRSETVTVVDFDFFVQASQYVLPHPTQWTVSDEEPAYRGAMALQVDDGPARRRRKATRKERRTVNARNEKRKAHGLPPWADVGDDEDEVLSSTRSIRAWADEYCTSTNMLKEFTYKKVIYGWNFSALEAAVTTAVRSAPYAGTISVQFTRRADEVHVRADNWLARPLSRGWFFLLLWISWLRPSLPWLWITLLYSLVWLFHGFFRGRRSRWEVCGGAYALTSSRLVGPEDDDASASPVPVALGRATLVRTQWGVAEVVGMREGEWFQTWEGTIQRAVQRGLKSDNPLILPEDVPLQAAMALDGYQARLPVDL
ncbi:hypothetical protein BDW22DRAFT_1416741 [Trametopsis cervina]|nr:hypothetical protein BDW22DRAFT_1416741 [Trametopsis cervina]